MITNTTALRVFLMAGLCLILAGTSVSAKHGREATASRVMTSQWSDATSLDNPSAVKRARGLNASAVATTFVLNSSKFDSGASCTVNSWTTVDLTAQTGDYWHVDDFAQTNSLGSLAGPITPNGITFTPVQGSKSMWMGQRIPPAGPVDPIHCGYVALPGYGNGWDQSFCSKACLSTAGGPTSNLDVSFVLKLDTETSYDGTWLEYTTDCSGTTGWTKIAPTCCSPAGWSAPGTIHVAGSYAVGPGPVKVRLHFTSDSLFSNEDGRLFIGLGVVVDSLSWEGTPVEDFEGEAIGAHSSDDWESCNKPGFGNYLALFKKVSGANYEDQCLSNLSCYWAALQGSTDLYSCGSPSQPGQKVVPYKNPHGTPSPFGVRSNQYIANEIWSPAIPISGMGSEFRLRYTVYRDLPLDNLVFHYWRVRAIPASGCPGNWSDNGNYYYGDSKDWAIADYSIGSRLDLTTATSLQVSLGVIDLCSQWCGVLGSGACHSPAPYFDSVRVLRVDTTGPQWEVRDIDTFNDNFATDGTITGTCRFDEAIDIKPSASATYTPGDSGIVLFLVDPKYVNPNFSTLASGLINDPTPSTFVGRNKTKNAVYMYATVTPFSAAKIGPAISEGPGGSANRYPFMGTVVAGTAGKTWAKVRMDYTYTGTAAVAGLGTGTQPRVTNRFNVDLNDNLFTPGDTIEYFYSASSLDGTTYFSTNWGSTANIAEVADNPMEVTMLPAGGFNRGGDILYVDGADGLGNQPYFDGAFMMIGMARLVDRYDVRAPGSAAGNGPGSRVVNVAAQLNAAYRKIIWDCGSLHITLGDGSGAPDKSDDYAMLNTFLSNAPGDWHGVYLCGDDVAETLNSKAGASAVTFRTTYMPFTLINGNHRLAPSLFKISPSIAAWPGRAFSDNFFIFGGCPELNDFDVIGASGTTQVQMSYNTAMDPNGAIVGHVQNNARVLLSGFSFANIRDDELNGISDRARHLYDIILWFGGAGEFPVGTTPLNRNALSQNYPNPFNPQTTIAFSIQARGHVTLSIYDVGGRLVRTLASETRAAGAYELTWDGRDDHGQAVASGVYFYKLVAGDFSRTKKMVLLK